MRSRAVVGNWKLNGSLGTNEALLEALRREIPREAATACAVCVPSPYLAQARALLDGSGIAWGAQDLSRYEKGAYTGEVSGPMLADLGCRYVLVGHSERRTLFGETDALVAQKYAAARRAGLTPVFCVGETLEERDAGRTMEVVLRQVGFVMSRLEPEQRPRVVIAYEPVWAIGTGRTATPEQAQEVMAGIRDYQASYDRELADGLRLLYGGSMNAGNAAELLAQPDIDGGLVGGASLKVDDFLAICQSAG